MRKPSFCSANRRRGFSLVELLAVLAVVTILMALMIPSFSGITGTAARRGSINILMNAFEQARTEALEKSARILVVMRREDGAAQDSFIVVRDDRSADRAPGSPEFVPLSRWQKLARGVLFFQAAGSLIGSGSVAAVPGLADSLPGSVPAGELFAIGFNKHGQVAFPSQGSDLFLLIAEAQRPGNSQPDVARGGSLAITERLSFRRYTGRAQLDFSAL